MEESVPTSVLVLILLSFEVTSAFQWTTPSSLPSGVTVGACPGQDVTLPWSYVTSGPAEAVTNVVWYFRPEGDGAKEELIATETFGTFLPIPTAHQKVQFLPTAGLRLIRVAIEDSGTYSVNVNINSGGNVEVQVQNVTVKISDGSMADNNRLDVFLLPDAMFDPDTQEFHLQLSCGRLMEEWRTRASVVVKTPNNMTLHPTSSINGHYFFSLPNPVATGDYTCAMDDNSPASLCLQSDSPLLQGSSVEVDGSEARFAVMEAKMTAQQRETEGLTQEVTSLRQNDTTLTQKISELKQEFVDLDMRTSSELETVASKVNFQIDLISNEVVVNDTIPLQSPDLNPSHALNYHTAVFTVPKNGTYFFKLTVGATYDTRYKHSISADIMADDVILATCISAYHNFVTQGGCQVIADLTENQRVYLRSRSDQTIFYRDYSQFAGFLLHEK